MTVKSIPSTFATYERPRFTPKGRKVDAALAQDLAAERRVVLADLLRALGDASADEIDTTEIDGREVSGRAAIEILALRDMVVDLLRMQHVACPVCGASAVWCEHMAAVRERVLGELLSRSPTFGPIPEIGAKP